MTATHAATSATRKVFTEGTHRVRSPEETWEAVRPLLSEYGITRVADVTGLDTLGLPVAMAVRPLSKTLAVSQGKGQSALLAKLSAAMESIELWYAERAVPDPDLGIAPARRLDLPYDLMDLAHQPGSMTDARRELSWVRAVDLLSGSPVPLPLDAVRLTLEADRPWQPPGLQASSNGLGSGNTQAEALLHALYEVVERDCLTQLNNSGHDCRLTIEPGSVAGGVSDRLVRLFDEAAVYLEIALVPNRWQVPCFVAYVWSEDFPVWSAGSGAHSSPDVALSRAITEAAQSRLTFITGTRDDLPALYHDDPRNRPCAPPDLVTYPDAVASYRTGFDDVTAELTWLTGRISRATGCGPLAVRLADRDELAVVRVVCPGLRFHARHEIPRPVRTP
ncbi:hypothetical protein C3486_03950 [Streptomyces sp. Ru73]|uniref:YcaO-like family protein n=1 Tax=Streptomyces sp. Ru73 TaxID=2080748 RepID=UPI000CDCF32C|nr:YcaO-like family protein [Streptomyces sp. Ru73]POX42732.1 hypothetical protein C3486_03950 [Streptomyces sp. Ru73]